VEAEGFVGRRLQGVTGGVGGGVSVICVRYCVDALCGCVTETVNECSPADRPLPILLSFARG
jgi:hypothetical protein